MLKIQRPLVLKGVELPAKDILYIILVCGSLAFGIQAMFLGMGGRLMIRYSKSRKRTLTLALGLGLCICVGSIVSNELIGLHIRWLVLWLVAYTGLFGAAIRAFLRKGQQRELRIPAGGSDRDLRKIIEKKGLNGLMKEKRENG